jgi:hypothetical protein
VEEMMGKIEKEILKELKFEKIKKLDEVNILINGKWFKIDKNIL